MNSTKKIIPFLIFLSLLTIEFSFSSAEIQIGDVYTYDLLACSTDFKKGETHLISSGIDFFGNHIPVDSEINIEITNITENRVDVNMIYGDYNYSRYYWDSNTYEMFPSIFDYIIFFSLYEEGSWWGVNLSLGYPIYYNFWSPFSYFYLGDPAEFYEVILEYKYYMTSRFHTKLDEGSNVNWIYEFQIDDGIMTLESRVCGKIIGQPYHSDKTYDVGFDNRFLLSFDNTTGLVYGMKYVGWLKGIINENATEISLVYHQEMKNYDMVDFNIDNRCRVGFNYVFFAVTIPIVFTSTICMRRKKRKKEDKILI